MSDQNLGIDIGYGFTRPPNLDNQVVFPAAVEIMASQPVDPSTIIVEVDTVMPQIILMGGGGAHLITRRGDFFKKFRIVSDPVISNAKGYLQYTEDFTSEGI